MKRPTIARRYSIRIPVRIERLPCILVCLLLVSLYAIAPKAGQAQQKGGEADKHVFCRLEALALRQAPSDGAPFITTLVRFNERLTAIKKWRNWVLVRTMPPRDVVEGWLKEYHITPIATTKAGCLPDLRRIRIAQSDDKLNIYVEGDIYYNVPIVLGGSKTTDSRQPCIFLSEYQHYFFQLETKEKPKFILAPGQAFTPEHLVIYEVRNQKLVNTALKSNPSFLQGIISEEDAKAHGATLGIALNYYKEMLATDYAYGFLWIEEVKLRKWSEEGYALIVEPNAKVRFGTKLFVVAEVGSDMLLVKDASGTKGLIRDVLLGGPNRIALLKKRGIIPTSLILTRMGSQEGALISEVFSLGEMQHATLTSGILPNQCLMFESKEVVGVLKERNLLPKGLDSPQAKTVYMCTGVDKFEPLK